MANTTWRAGVLVGGILLVPTMHSVVSTHKRTSDAHRSQDTTHVVPGAPILDPDAILPHVASWRLVQASSGNEVGRFTREVEYVNHSANEPTILTRWHFTAPQRSALDIYYVDRESLMPLARYVTAPNGMWVQYQSADRLIVTLTRRTGGEPLSIDIANPQPSFNNAMLDFVLASLPLAQGFTATWPSLGTSARSMSEALVTVSAVVNGHELMTLPNGTSIDTWIVGIELSNGNRQRVWISKTPPYLIRRDALNQNGDVTVRWELLPN